MSTYEARLAALRAQLKKEQLDGFVVPICDEHMSEYVGDYAQRLGWLTGFGGSAGSAVVLSEEARSHRWPPTRFSARAVDGKNVICSCAANHIADLLSTRGQMRAHRYTLGCTPGWV